MHVEFDTATADEREARGLVLMLKSVYPAIGDLFASTATITVTSGPFVMTSDAQLVRAADVPAIDTDAAAAFGAPDSPDAAQTFAPLPAGAGSAAAPAPVAGPAVSGVELDSAGMPWDARIHAGGKTQNKDLTWREKRGVGADVKAAVAAELRQVMAASPPAPVTAAPAPPPVVEQVAPPPPAPVAAAPAPAPAPITAPPSGLASFAAAMARVTAGQTAGHLTTDDVKAAVAAVGLTEARQLAQRPDLVPLFVEHIDAFIAAGQ